MPDQNLPLGFVCAAVATVGFGSNFVPVKKYQMGDGMFFQLTQALGIFCVGIVVQLIRGYRSIFRPWAMFGGFLWCTGNCMCTPIIQCIGMALGLLIWGACNMITGWCMGEWGLFWVAKSDPPAYPLMNIIGAIMALIATSIYLFVKPVPKEEQERKAKLQDGWSPLPDKPSITPYGLDSTRDSSCNVDYESGYHAIEDVSGKLEPPLQKSMIRKVKSYETFQGIEKESLDVRLENIECVNDPYLKYEETAQIVSGTSWVDELTEGQRRCTGISMSIIAGVLFGANFAPPTHLIDDQTSVDGNNLHNSPHGIDYVFSHFTGVILTSLTYFLVYSLAKNNKPQVNNQIIVPGWLSGVVWGIADTCWFIANDNLGLTTSYPIITTGPGVVASLWGVCVFGEVSGSKNLCILMVAFTFSIVAVTLITLSKTL